MPRSQAVVEMLFRREKAKERLVLDFVDANDRQDYERLAALFASKGTTSTLS